MLAEKTRIPFNDSRLAPKKGQVVTLNWIPDYISLPYPVNN